MIFLKRTLNSKLFVKVCNLCSQDHRANNQVLLAALSMFWGYLVKLHVTTIATQTSQGKPGETADNRRRQSTRMFKRQGF